MVKYIGKKLLEFDKILYLKKRLLKQKSKQLKNDEANRFLCIQLNSIGDAIMTQPCWAKIKKSIPDSTIDLMCRPHIAPLFKCDPSLSSIFSAENEKHRPWRIKKYDRIKKIFTAGNYDFIFDFTMLPLTAALCAGQTDACSVGFQRSVNTQSTKLDIGNAYDLSFPYSENESIRRMMLKLVSPWGQSSSIEQIPELWIEDDVMNKASNFLLKKGLGQKQFIVMHPGAKWSQKKWPLVHWRKLIKLVKEKSNITVAIIGNNDDKEFIFELASGNSTNFAYPFISDDLPFSSAIIQKALLSVNNDSAAMHIAAAVGTPSVSVFGPVAPNRSAPSPGEGCRVLYNRTFCSPCALYYSRDRCRSGYNFCMHQIGPDSVLSQIESISNTIRIAEEKSV